MDDPNIKSYSDSLIKLGIAHTIVTHPELKTPPETLAFLGLTLSDGASTLLMKAGHTPIAIVRRDDCRLDFKKIKQAVGVKTLRMATAQEFIELTHLPLGAARVYIPPLKTYLDSKLFEKEYVIGGSGSFTCSFRYKSEDLTKIPASSVVDIAK